MLHQNSMTCCCHSIIRLTKQLSAAAVLDQSPVGNVTVYPVKAWLWELRLALPTSTISRTSGAKCQNCFNPSQHCVDPLGMLQPNIKNKMVFKAPNLIQS